MKLCDMCYHKGEYRPGAIAVSVDVEHADLCVSCAESIRTLIFSPPEVKKPGRPKKCPQGENE